MPLEESFITSFFTELVIPMRNRLLRMDNIGINLPTTRGGKASMRILLADWISDFLKFLRWTCSSAWQSDPALCPRSLLWLQIGHKLNKMLAKCQLEPWPSSDKLLGSYWWCTCGGSEWDRQQNWWSKWQMWRMQFGPFVVYFHDKDLL